VKTFLLAGCGNSGVTGAPWTFTEAKVEMPAGLVIVMTAFRLALS
jgi:hypothetical protein